MALCLRRLTHHWAREKVHCLPLEPAVRNDVRVVGALAWDGAVGATASASAILLPTERGGWPATKVLDAQKP